MNLPWLWMNSFLVHPQLFHNGFPMDDGALVDARSHKSLKFLFMHLGSPLLLPTTTTTSDN
jgi:hypothetical protein